MKLDRLALLATLAGTAVQAADRIPAATPAGAPVNCVQLSNIDHTVVRDDSTVDFYMRDRTVYRNHLPNTCPELGFERAFSYVTSQTVLCNVDIITVIHQGEPRIPGAGCGLGQFQPVTLAGR